MLTLLASIFAESGFFSIFIPNLIPVRLVLIVLNIIGIFLLFKGNNLKELFKDKVFLSITAFVFFSFFSYFYTPDIRSYFAFMAFYLSLLCFYGILLTLKRSVQQKISVFEKTFYYTILFLNTLSIINAIKTFYLLENGKYWGPIRVVSTIQDENHYSMFLVIGAFITLYFIYTNFTKRGVIPYLLLGYTGVIFFALRSRSGFLALLFGLTIFAIFSYINNLSRKKLVYSYLILFVSIFVGALMFKPFTTTGTVRYISENNEKISMNSNLPAKRVVETKHSFEYFDKYVEGTLPEFLSEPSIKSHLALIYSSGVMGLTNPFLGVGVGGFNEVLLSSDLVELYSRYDPQAVQSINFPAHTMYGQAFAEGGFIGLILYLGILFFMGKKYWFNFKYAKDYNNKVLALSFLSIFSGFLVFSIFYNVHEEWFWVPALLGLVIVKTNNVTR